MKRSTLLNEQERLLLKKTAANAEREIALHYVPGFGICPSQSVGGNYYNQVWARDCCHATIHYFATAHPEAAVESLETLFRYQRPNGMLPLRVEREYELVKLTPVIGRYLAHPLFRLMHGGKERPVYEGQDFSGGKDTIPLILLAVSALCDATPLGQAFVERHTDHIKKAVDYFLAQTDPQDGLIAVPSLNPDWADSIERGGKLGTVNVLWTQGLKRLVALYETMGMKDEAARLRTTAACAQKSVLEKLWDKDGGCFRAEVQDDRLDTVATLLGASYFLEATEQVRVEEALERRVRCKTGLRNFDPPYPRGKIFFIHRFTGNAGYHNASAWPWVACQNIRLCARIAVQHPDAAVRDRYRNTALADLILIAQLFQSAGGACEIFRTDVPAPARMLFYTPSKNFLGSLAGFLGAYRQLNVLGWIT